MKRWDKVLTTLAVLALTSLIFQCKQAYPTEMPKLDRSGMYYVVEYEFDTNTQELVKATIVKDGTYHDCEQFIRASGPSLQHKGTYTVYGCERERISEGPKTTS